MLTIHSTTTADVATAFDYLATYTNTPKFFYGIKKLTPTSYVTRGLGATFDAELQMGATLKSTITCTEFVENSVFATESIKGIKNTTRWVVAPNTGGGTDITVEFDYHLGGGIAGAALSRLVEPFVAITVKHTTKALVDQLNG